MCVARKTHAVCCSAVATQLAGSLEMEWADVENESLLYEQWRRSQKGIGTRGARHWPH